MRAAKKQEDEAKSPAISVYMPRVSTSPRLLAASESWRSAEVAAASNQACLDHADNSSLPATGIPAKLLDYDFIQATTADASIQQSLVSSPPSHVSPRRSPTLASPSRDVGGTVYHKPPFHSQTQTSPSHSLVHRLKSFMPSATRPLTRQSRAQADIATEAVQITCNGPALDRFPLSIQGGLSSQQVKRAHTPAYEPRIMGHEREPLKQTWLVPNRSAEGDVQARCMLALFHSLIKLAERVRVPPVTFHSQEALGWEAYRRVEHKDAVCEPAFERLHPQAPLTAVYIQPNSKIKSRNSAVQRSFEAANGSTHVDAHLRRAQTSTRWGNTPLSTLRRAAFSGAQSDVQVAMGDVNSLSKSAPFVVSTYKKALREWEAASAPTSDPFVYINAKLERVTNSPLPVLRPPSPDVDGAAEHEARQDPEEKAVGCSRFERHTALSPSLLKIACRIVPQELRPITPISRSASPVHCRVFG